MSNWGVLLALDFVAVIVLSAMTAGAFIEGWSLLHTVLPFVGVVVAVALLIPLGSKYTES